MQSSRIRGLVLVVAMAFLVGCGGSRLFSGTGLSAPGQGGLLGSRTSRTDPSVRPTLQIDASDAQPETSIPPAPQRLVSSATRPDTSVSKPPIATALAQLETPIARPTSTAGDRRSTEIEQVRFETPAGTSLPDLPTSMPPLPPELAGVDLKELMEALRDAPPEVQAQAVRRLIAMSHRQAQATHQPSAIDAALSDSLDSLPTLPDEVVDQGLTPKRLATSETTMRLSDSGSTEKMGSSPPKVPVVEKTVVAAQPAAARVNGSVPVATVASMRTSTPPVEPVLDLPPPNEPPAETVPAKPLTQAQLFDQLIAQLAKKPDSESESERTRRLVMLRHLHVLAGNPDRGVDKLEGLSTEQQEFLRHQLLGLWSIVDPNGHPVASRRFSAALPEIREATRFLASSSETLDVRSLEFCTEIEAYGQIKPFASRKFQSGQEVILYCEIENFRCESVDRGFETVLQGSYDVLDSAGQSVSSQKLPVDRQVSRQPLRDYFIAYQMHLPASLAPAKYKLRLTMEDVHGRKYGQSEVEFEIMR